MALKQKILNNWPLIASTLVIGIMVLCYFVVPDFQSFVNEAYQVLTSDDEVKIKSWVGELGVWGPLFIILAMVVQMFLIFVPSPLLMVVSVLAYGPVWGAVLAVISVMVSSTIGFFVGKMIGTKTLYQIIGQKKEEKMESYVSDYGLWVVIVSRVSPIFSNDAISFVGGMVRMNYLKFIGATFLGITPLAILIAWFGENNDRLRSGLIWTSVVCVILLVLYIIFDRKRSNKLSKK